MAWTFYAPDVSPSMGISLPANPVDGQEFTLVDSMTAPTYSWKLRYVAAKASNKWVFIGGSPLSSEVATDESTSTTATWLELATSVIVTAPVAGSYRVSGTANLYASASGRDGAVGISVNNATPSFWAENQSVGTAQMTFSVPNKTVSLSASDTVRQKYYNGTAGTTLHAMDRVLLLTPIAIGG